jgi:sugar lactone lactonase YvrE
MKQNYFSRLALVIFLIAVRSAPAATFTLGSGALLEGPTAGTDSILLAASPNNSAWTASTNNPWLHLSAANQSGGFSTNVIFSFDANAGLTRTGSLAIAGQTLNIIQAGANYVAAKGAMPLIISSNLHFPNGIAVNAAGNAFVADSFNNAIKKWTLTNNSVSTLIGSGLNHPNGIATDAAGNLYIADTSNNAIKKWNVTNSTVSTVIAAGLNGPYSVAVDGTGNIFILETSPALVKKWTAANSNLTTIISTGLSGPTGLAVDAAGNAFVADQLNSEIDKWNAASGTVSALFNFSLGLDPVALVVDGSGNVWFSEQNNYALMKWVAASNTVVTVATTGIAPSSIDGLALDGFGNFYMTDFASNTVKVLQLAFVDPSAKNEGAAAGTDALPPVLPTTQNFLPPFAPTSDQSWLTISGVTNGVVNFAFTATTSNRTAHISLLGKSITVTQSNSVVVTPPVLITPKISAGSFQFAFSNNQGATFSVVASTNLLVPLTNWNVVGTATNTAPGLFQFAIPTTNTEPRKFFRVRSP